VDPPQPSDSASSGPIFVRNATHAKVNNRLYLCRVVEEFDETCRRSPGAAVAFGDLDDDAAILTARMEGSLPIGSKVLPMHDARQQHRQRAKQGHVPSRRLSPCWE
jgi:hypothetical protein